MKRLSLSISRFYDHSDLPRGAAIGYLSAFILVMFYALYTNRACLFFDYDGVEWAVTMDYFERLSSSFSIALIDPLQGMFDIYFQGYRGTLPQNLVMRALGMPGLNKIVIHVSYSQPVHA